MNSNRIDAFWIVWIPGRGAPNKRHDGPLAARCEAERLVAREKQPAYVLECIGMAEIEKPVEPPVVYRLAQMPNRMSGYTPRDDEWDEKWETRHG